MRAWMLAWITVGGAIFLSSVQLQAQSDLERFRLFNGCRPMDLLMLGLGGDAVDIGLTRERVQTLTESRLRAARLYSAERKPTLGRLEVGAWVAENTFHVAVIYKKPLDDSASSLRYLAATWIDTGYGRIAGDGGFVMQELSEKLDLFILRYLRVNEGACDP